MSSPAFVYKAASQDITRAHRRFLRCLNESKSDFEMCRRVSDGALVVFFSRSCDFFFFAIEHGRRKIIPVSRKKDLQLGQDWPAGGSAGRFYG